MSIETRSNSALLKRAEQLKRWQESDTCRRCGDTRRGYKPKVQFTDGCVFLAACAASDKEEVRRLLARGADIDTANVDGLTALHQACIDDNLEMVEFLVERGADVNRGDNEGWTPLHATASCGFLSIAKYLLEHKCNVAAVNNDGELAIDISESDEMEELLQAEISSRSIDCEASRIVEERLMFEDAKKWVETDKFGDIPHQKTGATSLHVASAKGYIKVIGLLLECQAPISIQDYDGWTPLHAAAHWAQREAIELLCKNMADMDIKNYVGQTCFDVADPDVLKLLESLKREQATIQKEKPDIRNLVNRPSISSGGGKRRSSITRLSIDDKELRSKKDSSYERDSLRGSSLVSETIQESNKFNADSDVGRKNRANLSDVPKITLSKDESSSNKVPGYSPPHPPEDNKKKIASSPVETSPDEVHPWRRPLSLRSRPVSSSSTSSSSAVNNNNNKLQKDDNSSDSDVPLRRIHSFESDEKFYSRLTELREKIRSHHSNSSSGVETTPPPSSRSNSSSRYLNPSSSSPSGGGGRSGNFSSLPRSHKPLPSLPEHSKTPSPSTPTNGTAAACGSLFRSASLRDNSTPFRRPPESSSQINLNTLNNNNSSSSSSSPNNRTQFNNNDNNNNNNNDNNNINNNNNYDNNHNRRPCRLSSARTESGEFSPSDFYSPRPSSLLLGRNIWKRYDPDGANRVNKSDSLGSNSLAKGHQPPQSHVRRSFVPPVRDEESETQRKAHAKRVRETRRSTQGVTLEDLKSAEQLVKKKQQQENQIRTSELQQLAAAGVGSTATTTVTTSATLVAASGGGLSPASTTSSSTSSSSYERKPSWRIKTAEASSDKNKFRLEDAGPSETLNALRKSSKMEGKGPPPLPASEPPSLLSPTGKAPSIKSRSPQAYVPFSHSASSRSNEASLLNNSGTQQVIQRRKKPKRRSTGVVHLDLGDLDKEDEEGDEESEESDENLSGDAAGKGSSSSSKYLHPNNAQHQAGGYHNKSGGDKETHNGGEMDYKKLWEESQLENSRLREELSRSEDTRGRLEGALDSASKPQPISEAEKREKRALEKKLSEMEEELKQIEHLKNEIQRLRDENGALIRVISKLSK